MNPDMNKIIALIEKVRISGVLLKNLHFIPAHGAQKESLQEIEEKIGSSLSNGFRNFLTRWDGINLDVIEFFGSEKSDAKIMKLSQQQYGLLGTGRVVIASDPSGYLYAETIEGIIYSIDTDGEEDAIVAQDIEDFLCNYIFGNRAAEFGGEEWAQELRDAKII